MLYKNPPRQRLIKKICLKNMLPLKSTQFTCVTTVSTKLTFPIYE